MNAPVSKINSTPRSSNWRRAILIVVIIGSSAVGILWWLAQRTGADLANQAKRSLRRSDFELALNEAEGAIQYGQDTPAVRLIAGEAAVRLKRDSVALNHFEHIDDAAGRTAFAARLSTASVLIHQHEVGRAEDQLRRALVHEPQDDKVHRLLSECLGLQGRRWEAIPHLLHGIERGDINLQSLCYLSDTDRTVELSEQQLTAFVASDSPKCWLGAACVAISYREFEKAEQFIRRCLAADPEIVEAHVRLGKQLLSNHSQSAMEEWESNLPKHAGEHPGIWFIRSEWCLMAEDHQQAGACLWQALSIHPDHSAANHQMGHVLSLLDRPTEAEGFRERGRKLTRLATLANEIYLGDTRSSPLKESADLVESLGRIPEAIGWAVAAQYENPAEAWPVETQRRLGQKSGLARSRQNLQSIEDLRLAWTPPLSRAPADQRETVTTASFRDVSTRIGIDFRYENAEDPLTDGRLMFEYTGGGVGVLDFDGDNWPDIYFTQGSAQPPGRGQTLATDAMFRNLRGDRFAEVSHIAGLRDFGFGQGVAAGDINNDGFVDLYVANIDGNRLYINHGDGTFEDVTAASGIGHKFWSTSVAIADLDCDTVPDLYDVTFLNDKDVFQRVCEEDGVARSCAPAGFAAADDFIFQGRGNGTFLDVSDAAGIRVPDGDGLGILIADFAADGIPSIFIANDGRPNFYFKRDSSVADHLVFAEQALNCGLAFDRDGRSQACMGVASSDFDGNGTWDLFVTNFFNESNTLYSQAPGEHFLDNSQQAGIRERSLGMLGFGTQALDAELDGWEDLIIGNGHVDNFEYKGIPYRMPLEYYHNNGMAGFAFIDADQVGEVFKTPTLSRSMAVIDWNRDGMAEVAVSRLDDPALLLENTTANAGGFLAVQIVGKQVARDATTTRLTATVNGRAIVRQFTAGDGYQSSNQKQVIFGLGQAEAVEELRVDWQNGHTQTFHNLAAGQTVILREGDEKTWVLSP